MPIITDIYNAVASKNKVYTEPVQPDKFHCLICRTMRGLLSCTFGDAVFFYCKRCGHKVYFLDKYGRIQSAWQEEDNFNTILTTGNYLMRHGNLI